MTSNNPDSFNIKSPSFTAIINDLQEKINDQDKSTYQIVFDKEVQDLGIQASWLLACIRNIIWKKQKPITFKSSDYKVQNNYSHYKFWVLINILRTKGYITTSRKGFYRANSYDITDKGWLYFKLLKASNKGANNKGIKQIPSVDDVRREIENQSYHNIQAESFWNWCSNNKWHGIWNWRGLLRSRNLANRKKELYDLFEET
jgi:hypothetical protein